MRRPTASSTFTTDFRREFAAETDSLLRRRFGWFAGLLACIGLCFWAIGTATSFAAAKVEGQDVGPSVSHAIAGSALSLLNIAIAGGCFFWVRRTKASGSQLLRTSYVLVAADGLIRVMLARLEVSGSLGLAGVMLTHSLACILLPWTPRQSLVPPAPPIVLWIVLNAVFSGSGAAGILLGAVLAPLLAGPGVMICWLKDSSRLRSFRARFFEHRYGAVRRELTDARRIHESLFPREIPDGPIQLTYRYEPMGLIGGDYLFAHRLQPSDDQLGSLSVVLIDVTGHGITAALTVNRLYGELARIFAEEPFVAPGQVLRLLNRYIHLTLSPHSIYATALCMRIDLDRDHVEYANGGHPPAFLRGVDNTLHELESTAMVLGASADSEFSHGQQTRRFARGDTMVLYTDGAIEAASPEGMMLGLNGLRRILSARNAPPLNWPDVLLGAVADHRRGAPLDDTLIVQISRAVDVEEPSREKAGATRAVQGRA
ncbi:MAG: serine/threonine-protein phosphatase [Planctomycetes bacterium]|nr:serine/threonine-protein phosphatase [Planctomycetota bacterium]